MFAIALLAGCASVKETHEQLVTGKIPRPAHIWVYDFAATASDIPTDSALYKMAETNTAPQTAEHIAMGRKLGAELATELVNQIVAIGMPAKKAGPETQPQVNDLVIRGYLVSFVEGDKAKRIGIGFGDGASNMQVAAEGFQVTADGLRKLGGGSTNAGGGKTPGAALGVVGLIATHNPVGLLVSTGVKVHDEKDGSSTVEGRASQTVQEITDQLKVRFQEQGWVK